MAKFDPFLSLDCARGWGGQVGEGRPGQSGTFVLKSTGGFGQRDVSPCMHMSPTWRKKFFQPIHNTRGNLAFVAAEVVDNNNLFWLNELNGSPIKRDR